MRDAASETQRMWGVAGSYALGPAKLFAGYLGGKDATGMVDTMLNDSSRTVSYGYFPANPREDMTFYTGLTYQVSGALTMTGVVYQDNIRNVNGVAGQSGKRLIALHWQGKPGHEHSLYSRGRSMTLADWLPLRQLENVEFLSVQKGEAAEQLQQAHGLPMVAGQAAFSETLDFRETAAVLANCDLLLSSDSGVVHLAGALGVPTWVALRWIPEWRWGLSGSRTPWYASLRLFRQQRDGDWAGVVAEITREIKAEIAAARA
jgi:hypothetical protein